VEQQSCENSKGGRQGERSLQKDVADNELEDSLVSRMDGDKCEKFRWRRQEAKALSVETTIDLGYSDRSNHG